MKDAPLPQNMYRLAQKEFDIIPGSPLIYWLNFNIRDLFKQLELLSEVGASKVGINTGHNERFVRWSWEINITNSTANWQPYISGGPKKRYYGNLFYLLNWSQNEISEYPGSALRARQYQGKEGLTYGLIGSGKPAFRYLPPGYMFSSGGNCIFLDNMQDILALLGILNSSISTYLLKIINPTINLSVGDILRLPIAKLRNHPFTSQVLKAIRISKYQDHFDETTINFTIPIIWRTGSQDFFNLAVQMQKLDIQIDNEVFALYGISPEDRIVIEVEIAGGSLSIEKEELTETPEELETTELPSLIAPQEIAFRWISYAIGVVLGRFQPGFVGSLGSAIYRRTDFAIGSLPEPTEEEFNELVGEPSQFAYIDEQDGRHVFSLQVEQALQKLALSDGIAVFDINHPRDLPSLVSKALELMLGQAQAQEVIQQAAGGDLRKYLEKDFFTQHHIKQYRKRPVYWPIQSSKRSYGFVLFHEKIDRNTFYALQQEPYLPTKRRAVQLRLEELGKKVLTAQGAARKPIEKEMDELRQLAEELAQFAKDLDAITRGGNEPEADWIDDGVILRMAPLWSVIPLWKSEPKKYWDELAAGKYDWSRIAMKYWPERVKKACAKNKSYAIAHGHEDWYKGG